MHDVKSVSLMLMRALALVCLLTLPIIGISCSQGDEGIAARCEGVTVTEDEVTQYTADYRKEIDASNDESWARYLRGHHLSAKTWREQCIRLIVGRRLVQRRADELGIVVDERQVEAYLEMEKGRRGAPGCNDATWKAILEEEGTTPEKFLDNLRYASLLEQVLLADGGSTLALDDEVLQSYVEANLMDRVVRRFSVLSFAVSEKEEAESTLIELKSLAGEELIKRFEDITKSRFAGNDELVQGDLGWNLLYSLNGVLDGDKVLALRSGDLYPDVVEREDGWQIYLCTDYYAFEGDETYSEIKDETLKQSIERSFLLSSWDAWSQNYLTKIVDDAKVEVFVMPENLPYDVDDVIASLDSAGEQ